MLIGERIKELRETKKITQNEFAAALNLSKQTISNYETGAREPNLSLTITIAEYFDVTTDYLLGRTEIQNTEAWNYCKDNKKLFTILNHMLKIIKFLNSSYTEFNLSYVNNEFVNWSEKLFLALNQFYEHIFKNSFRGGIYIKDLIKKAEEITSGIKVYLNELSWYPFEIYDPDLTTQEDNLLEIAVDKLGEIDIKEDGEKDGQH